VKKRGPSGDPAAVATRAGALAPAAPARPPKPLDQGRAIERLRRLWALAAGSGPEAIAARRIARELEDKSGIAMRRIHTTPIPHTTPPAPVLRITGAGGLPLLEWETLLINGIADLFGVLVLRVDDGVAFVGPRHRVEDAHASLAELLGELTTSYRSRVPAEHAPYLDHGLAIVQRWNGATVVLDIQGWWWEFAIAFAYSSLIELLKLYPKPLERPDDLSQQRAALAIGARKVTLDDQASRMPVQQETARTAGTLAGRAVRYVEIGRRLERYHGREAKR